MRAPDRDSPLWDVALAVTVGAVAIVDVATSNAREGALWVNLLVMVVYAGLLGVRRRAPVLASFGFVGVLLVLSAFLTPPPELVTIFLGLLAFPYTAGSVIRGPVAAAYLPAVFAGIAIANVAADKHASGDWIFPPTMALVAFLAGRNVVHRALLAAELHEAGLRAEEDRAGEARHAVAEERRRIAREMHDVVAHSISVMVVQAGGARRIVERDPDRAAQAAELIERTGRETLEEMRRLLGIMRVPEAVPEADPTHPPVGAA
jgi:signal transduction histidine kinase